MARPPLSPRVPIAGCATPPTRACVSSPWDSASRSLAGSSGCCAPCSRRSRFLRRIKAEESELVRVLREPYGAYSARTKRLIPGIC
jgi:protein-S-isoprenylcysteine O-methyltransferase Ste14